MNQTSGEYGVLRLQELPEPSWQECWDGIVVSSGVKERILNYALFVLGQRRDISQVGLPIHGILLFQGPPGTGKTTLARGLAHTVAVTQKELVGTQAVYCEIDAYRLASGLLGESQKHVERLFFRSIPNLASSNDHLIVLLDEVENIAVSRERASLDANPVDVHRATNALLTGLDHVSNTCTNVLLLATSNFVGTLDSAFLSRVDIIQQMEVPGSEVLAEIVLSTLAELGADGSSPIGGEQLASLARALEGLDGRQARKQVLETVISERELALDPTKVTAEKVIATLLR